MIKIQSIILQKVRNLSFSPGCYCFQNSDKLVIYVGKAKNLQKRVMSYFKGSYNQKTQKLVSEIGDLFCIITNSEEAALILESNLIKKYLPKYNFKLIDDKTYPYIEITQEPNPVLKISRYKIVPKGKMIFGPYPKNIREIVKILQKVYPLRRCLLSEKKPCFYYHIGQCLGPCTGQKIDYTYNIQMIQNFLKGGDNKNLLKQLKINMNSASDNLHYEHAQEYLHMIKIIKNIDQEQVFNGYHYFNSDLLAYCFNQDEIALQILKIRLGKIIDIHRVIFSYIGEILENVITYVNLYYQKELCPEILIINQDLFEYRNQLSVLLPLKIHKVSLHQKQQKLYQLALKNAEEDLTKHNLIYRIKNDFTQQALEQLSFIFKKNINHIEVFDNSQLFSQHYVSVKIVFKNLEFNKNLYRKYILNDNCLSDLDAFVEVLTRNYSDLQEPKVLPDLILLDGGVVQFNVGLKMLNLFNLDISLGSLQKNQKHKLQTLITSQGKFDLRIDVNLFNFLSKLIEEVHRFVLKFHHQRKYKSDMQSLFDIKGLDVASRIKILEYFLSFEHLKKASYDEFKKLGIKKNIFLKIKNCKF